MERVYKITIRKFASDKEEVVYTKQHSIQGVMDFFESRKKFNMHWTRILEISEIEGSICDGQRLDISIALKSIKSVVCSDFKNDTIISESSKEWAFDETQTEQLIYLITKAVTEWQDVGFFEPTISIV